MKRDDRRSSVRRDQRQRRVLVPAVFAAALVTGLLAFLGSAQVPPPANGKIAFDASVRRSRVIISMNPDGSGQKQLTKNNYDSSARWSPDGTKIAFQRSTNSLHFEIYSMNADGTGITQLTNDQNNSSFQPTWSPDGTQIAFAKGPDGGSTSDIYVINSNGTGSLTNLTNLPAAFNVSPAWSPDGTLIAFGSARNGSSEDIWVMNSNGTNQQNLTSAFTVAGNESTSQERWPAWSPSSNRIAFYTNRDGLNLFHIYLINPDGTGITAQTTLGAATFDFDPTWSPDGTKIAFASNRTGTANEVYVMDATTPESTTNTPTALTNLGDSIGRPNWAVAVPAPPCTKKHCP